MDGDDTKQDLEARSPNVRIKDPESCLKCAQKQCVIVCPAGVFQWDRDEMKIQVDWLACLETGACLVACHELNNIEMTYPDAGTGVRYKYG